VTLRALAFGETLIDEFPDRRVVAGAPLHVAAHLAALGWAASIVGRVGDDPDGVWVRRIAGDLGVDGSLLQIDSSLPTGTVQISLDPQGAPAFTISRPAAWDAIAPPEAGAADVVYFGTLAQRHPRSRRALRGLLDSTAAALKVADVNLRPPDIDPMVIAATVSDANLLKLSDEELVPVTAALGLAPRIEAILEAGPEWVCVTAGDRGATLARRGGEIWAVEVDPVDVVDTVGAGDAFCAGLIDGIARRREGAAVLQAATALAGETVRRRGGLPPGTGSGEGASQSGPTQE